MNRSQRTSIKYRRFKIPSLASKTDDVEKATERERERVSRSFVFLLRSRSFLSFALCLSDVSLVVVAHPLRVEVRHERFMSNNLINKIGEVPDGHTSFLFRLTVREETATRIWASRQKLLFSLRIDQY